MDERALRDGLMAIGLTQYEADAYAALLELGRAPAVDVAQAADVPRARIYDVVRSLAEQGYVETFDDGGLHARAVDPEAAVDELSSAADHLQSTADAVEERWEEPPIANRQISVVKRFETLFRLARERIAEAEFGIKIAATPAQYAELEDALTGAREDGVVVKLTLHGEELDADEDHDALTDLVGGVPTETRVRELPTSLLIVVDHREVLFAPHRTPAAGGEQGLFLDDAWFAEMADWYFRTALWAVWEPIQRDPLDRTTYTDIRECLRAVAPIVEDGGDVRAAVTPIEEPDRRIEGEIADVTYRPTDETGGSPLEPYVDVAALTLATDDGAVEVGNWDAVVEDVRAGRIEILDVEA